MSETGLDIILVHCPKSLKYVILSASESEREGSKLRFFGRLRGLRMTWFCTKNFTDTALVTGLMLCLLAHRAWPWDHVPLKKISANVGKEEFHLKIIPSDAHLTMGAEHLPVYGRVPAFQLLEQTGKSFEASQLKGKIWIADFIFTRCSDQCPLLSAKMAKLQSTFSSFPNVILVSFTLDPGYDTPAVLRNYAAHWGAVKNRWLFLTGNNQVIQNLRKKTFHLESMTNRGSKNQILAHSNYLILVDGQGRIRGYYDSSRPELLKKLMQDAAWLVHRAKSFQYVTLSASVSKREGSYSSCALSQKSASKARNLSYPEGVKRLKDLLRSLASLGITRLERVQGKGKRPSRVRFFGRLRGLRMTLGKGTPPGMSLC